MKSACCAAILAMCAACVLAEEVTVLQKVLIMIDELTAKINKEGEAEAKAYHEFFEWCDDTTKNMAFEIKTGASKKEELVTSINKLKSDIADSDIKIEELVAAIAKDKKELKDATAIREKEHADFVAEENDLMEGIDTLDRAIGIIEKALASNPGAFAQVDVKNMNSLLNAIGTMMDAAAIASLSKKKLLAMVQRARSDSDDEDPGAPAPSAYASKAGGIVEVLESMKDKAEEDLQELRSVEQSAANNFAMLKQSLDDSMMADNKDLDDEKVAKSTASQDKATAESDLEVTTKALAGAEKELTTTQNMCMQTSVDHEASKQSRAEELKVIAEAKKIIEESTGGAAVAEAVDFLQIRSGVTQKVIASREVVAFVKQLAKKDGSSALAQLASRIATAVKLGRASGEDPFEKVKGLIVDLIAKLEKEAKAEATEKAYCDEQMSKTEAKKADLDDTMAKLTSKIDKSTARSTELKAEVKILQEELAALLKEQEALDKLRQEEHEAYLEAKKDLEAGLAGVRKALEVLRKYYGGAAFMQADAEQPKMPEYHSAASGAGGGIISMLEVVESDISKSLATTEKEEADGLEEYETTTQENEMAKTEKTQDVKYKTQEYTALDKSVNDLSADRETTAEELDAVEAYYEKLKDRCIAKPETYASIKARRDAEIAGLKEALTILEGSAFAQSGRHGRRHHFLGF